MYSVVLMAALTSGSASPEFCWHRHHSCHSSCHSCYSSCYGSCYGCGGCYQGVNFYAGYSGWCSGCYSGGCYSCYSSYACSGWGYGCYSSYSCYGCYSSYAGYGCYAGYSGYAGYPISYTCSGCYGCYAGHSGYGTPVYAGDAVASPAIVNPPATNVPSTTVPSTTVPYKETTPAPREKMSGAYDRARILVQVPDDAKLYIDGNLMRTGSANRVFQTPVLQQGKTYYYDLRVEVVRDGQTVVQEKQVLLRPGQEVAATFDLTAPAATAQVR
jgi:uncharacterized protein (TIGR03000 family)